MTVGVPRILRTQVGIIGAGPAGLLLAQLLARRGVDTVVLENRGRAYVEARIRAGVLEHATVDMLTEAGVGDRLHREGLRHDGVHLQWPGERHRVDFADLCGRSVWVYGQTEVVKDLIAARLDSGAPLYFDVRDTAVHDLVSDRPAITFTSSDGTAYEVRCDVVAGCDGFHGISREAVPAALRTTWERAYPYAWLGVLADVAPSTDELIYAWHPDGFAMHSLRSTSVSRLYLQVDADEKIEDWSDGRIWDALSERLAVPGWTLQAGPVREKSITPMRSFVSAPMRHGRLFLAGDAAHIVPPTGAKGLNLAAADAWLLADAVATALVDGHQGLLESYGVRALHRVWRATHFSWWMTAMLHPATGERADAFDRQLQLSQLRYVTSSRAAAASLAENYTGLALERASLP